MSELRLRVQAWWGQVRSSLWFLPSVAVVVAIVLAEALGRGADSILPQAGGWLFAGTPTTALSVLQTIATSIITVTGLAFSMTVVALQVASGQYSPRLLRGFLADRGNQVVLSGLMATFAYSLVLSRHVRTGTADQTALVPTAGLTVAILLALGSVALLVYFFHHVTTQLRIETIMEEVTHDTLAAIDRVHPAHRDDDESPPPLPEPPDRAHRITAAGSGQLQSVDLPQLLRVARRHGVHIRLRHWVGDHVAAGTTLAWTWPAQDATPASDDDHGALHTGVLAALYVGRDRILTSDPAFGIRQLVDIGVRAMSPSVNDPTTCVQVVQRLTELLVVLDQRGLHDAVLTADGVSVGLPRAGFEAYLALAQDQIRRFGAHEPAVAAALLRCLRDVAETTTDAAHLEAVRAHARLVEDRIAGVAALHPADLDEVREASHGIERVLAGRTDATEASAD